MKFWYAVMGVLVCSAAVGHGGSVRGETNFVVEADDRVIAVDVQSDGKIIIGGFFNNVNGVPRSKLARLNSDGSVDESFNIIGETLTGYVRNIALRDGKIYASVQDGQGIRRYDSNGVFELRFPVARAFAIDSKRRLVWGTVTDEAYY